jgi:hypothetical protein
MTHRLLAGLLLSALMLPAADPALTIYNQNFAVVRDTVPLDLKPGVNRIRHTGLTARAEPDSVILRDPAGKINLQILEQNYLADPVSLENLLSFYEGKTIEFQLNDGKIVSGKIVRAGRAPLPGMPAMARQASMFANPAQPSYNNFTQPLIESEGKLRFDLPGVPLFPVLANDAILKPTLDWLIRSDRAAKLDAELGYLSGGMNWKADYNIIASDESDAVQLIGWVTIANQSGKSFANARIALMAGDVNKLQPANAAFSGYAVNGVMGGAGSGGPPVVEQTFDDYNLYTLHNPTHLPEREPNQVEFLRAGQVSTKRIYVYDGMQIDNRFQNWNYDAIRGNPEYGTQSNPKVWVMREFVNNEANHLGMPLPQGNVRFYRRDTTGQLEFTGENQIRHTPKDETIQVYTGTAFDVVGERRRTDYQINHANRTIDEAFEIKLRNHKREPVALRVVEHLYRGYNWNITIETDQHTKKDSQTVEYQITVKPDEEKILKYSVHYTW